MSLRSLGYLLTRRHKMCRVQAEGILSQAASVSTAGRPDEPSLHTAVVAAALAGGGLGIFILKKHQDGAVGSNEDTKEASCRKTEGTDNKPAMEARFRAWMKREGRVYPNQEEERKRFEIFKETVEKMEALHEKSSVRVQYLPERDSRLHWADMTYEEIKEMGREEEKALTRMTKERAQKLMEEGKLSLSLVFPEKQQEREEKTKEEGSLHDCSKQ